MDVYLNGSMRDTHGCISKWIYEGHHLKGFMRDTHGCTSEWIYEEHI